MVVAPIEDKYEGLRETIQELSAFYDVYDRLVELPHTERLQRGFNILTDIFYCFCLHTNVHKMVTMACRQCYTPGGHLESAYMQHVTGVGPSYLDRLRQRVQCLYCGVGMVPVSLMEYQKGQHVIVWGDQGHIYPPSPPGGGHTYWFSFP